LQQSVPSRFAGSSSLSHRPCRPSFQRIEQVEPDTCNSFSLTRPAHKAIASGVRARKNTCARTENRNLEELLQRDFCDFTKVIRISTYFKELLEMLVVIAIATARDLSPRQGGGRGRSNTFLFFTGSLQCFGYLCLLTALWTTLTVFR
jgi:hypothetical protein